MSHCGLKHIMRSLAGGAVGITAVIGSMQAAVAGDYGANYIGQSYGLTWLFTGSQTNPVGYACLVRDSLEGMSRDVTIHRYEILADLDYVYMQSLNSVVIYREDGQYVAKDIEAISEDEFGPRAQMNASETWYANNDEVMPLGRACVDSGVAGALQEVERSYGITIQEQ